MPGFDPDQPRDEKGQWTDTGAGTAIKSAASDKKKYTVGFYTGMVMEEGTGKTVGFFHDMTDEQKKQYGVEGYGEVKGGYGLLPKEGEEIPGVVTSPAHATQAINKAVEKGIINEDHVYAVSKYTGSDYTEINQPLRQGLSPEETQHARIIKALDEFLQVAPKYNGVSYRGIRFINESAFNSFLSDVNDDAIIEDEAFGSTTTEKSNIKIFSLSGMTKYSVEMTIKGKSGVYVEPLSSMTTEHEVLYPRKTKFKVNNVRVEEVDKTSEDAQKGFRDLRKKAIIELEEIN